MCIRDSLDRARWQRRAQQRRAAGPRTRSRPGSGAASRPMSRASHHRGFSLLEMLVSLALLGILMVTLNTFLFSMSELWGGGRDKRLFDQHTRAATALVKRAFAEATLGPGASGVALKDVDNGAGTTEPRLGFLLPDAGRPVSYTHLTLPTKRIV